MGLGFRRLGTDDHAQVRAQRGGADFSDTHDYQYLEEESRSILNRETCFSSCGSFRNLGVPYFGVLMIRILLFRVLY